MTDAKLTGRRQMRSFITDRDPGDENTCGAAGRPKRENPLWQSILWAEQDEAVLKRLSEKANPTLLWSKEGETE